MQDVSADRASVPPRIAAMVPDRGFLAAMPAYLPTTGGLAAKLVSLFPGNAQGPLPTHQAVVMVFDPDSGEPLALMDGTSITTLRTAAGSALSAELLAREDANTLAILGTGVQARAHAEAMVRVRPIRHIRVAGTKPGTGGVARVGSAGLTPDRRASGRHVCGGLRRCRRGVCGDALPRSRGAPGCPEARSACHLGGFQHGWPGGGLRDRGRLPGRGGVSGRCPGAPTRREQRPDCADARRAHRARTRPRRDRRTSHRHEDRPELAGSDHSVQVRRYRCSRRRGVEPRPQRRSRAGAWGSRSSFPGSEARGRKGKGGEVRARRQMGV